MAKKTAVLAVNPVNGSGLFQYLEAFYENEIPYTVFAVADTRDIRTNSGIPLQAHDVIASLKGREDDFDALVFACGDAVPHLKDNMEKSYNQDLMQVIGAFGRKGKIMIGHCGAGLLFDGTGIASGKKIALHPYVKQAVKHAVATDEKSMIDGTFFTAQTENTIESMLPQVIAALR